MEVIPTGAASFGVGFSEESGSTGASCHIRGERRGSCQQAWMGLEAAAAAAARAKGLFPPGLIAALCLPAYGRAGERRLYLKERLFEGNF